ncbi:MAG: hypothetical protein ACKOXP_08110 [Flavobacteriales bacterium]
MTHFIEISPEYMAAIEAEITQSATKATDDSLANYTTLRLHEQLGGIQFVEIEHDGYYIFPVEDEPGDDNELTPDPYPFIMDPSDDDDLPF